MDKGESTGLATPMASPQDITPPASTTYHPSQSETEMAADEWLRTWWGLPEGTTFTNRRWKKGVLHVVAVTPPQPLDMICVRLTIQL